MCAYLRVDLHLLLRRLEAQLVQHNSPVVQLTLRSRGDAVEFFRQTVPGGMKKYPLVVRYSATACELPIACWCSCCPLQLLAMLFGDFWGSG